MNLIFSKYKYKYYEYFILKHKNLWIFLEIENIYINIYPSQRITLFNERTQCYICYIEL